MRLIDNFPIIPDVFNTISASHFAARKILFALVLMILVTKRDTLTGITSSEQPRLRRLQERVRQSVIACWKLCHKAKFDCPSFIHVLTYKIIFPHLKSSSKSMLEYTIVQFYYLYRDTIYGNWLFVAILLTPRYSI